MEQFESQTEIYEGLNFEAAVTKLGQWLGLTSFEISRVLFRGYTAWTNDEGGCWRIQNQNNGTATIQKEGSIEIYTIGTIYVRSVKLAAILKEESSIPVRKGPSSDSFDAFPQSNGLNASNTNDGDWQPLGG